jgi:hypothetical protein
MDDVYSEHSMWFADAEERADQVLEREALQSALTKVIATLPEREAMVLQALLRGGNEPRGNRRHPQHRRRARLPDQEGGAGQGAGADAGMGVSA